MGLMGVMAFSMLAATGCGSSSGDADDEHTFSWWITTDDGKGTFYDKYEDNPAVQWLNQQYWDVENGGLGTGENGKTIDLTPWVEEYMPNYQAFLESNPDEAAQVTSTDEDGNVHYYQLARIKDGNDVPWGGYVYRRDWVVEYAEPTAYVWDWDSEYVKQNGHPEVTPLAEAERTGNYNGWYLPSAAEAALSA